MQTLTFKYKPGSTGSVTFRTKEAKFGDGYAQRAKDGLNHTSVTWPLVFEGGETEMYEVYDFLIAHAGTTPFLWTPPGGVVKKWICQKFSIQSIGAGVYSVSAELLQSHNP